MTEIDENKQKKTLIEIEKAIIKRYRKELWRKFVSAIRDYQMINDGDTVAVAISGGKDSLLMAKMFQNLQKYYKIKFKAVYIAMDPGYHPEIRRLLEENCAYLDIPVNIFESNIFEAANKIAADYPCYICAKMRRGALYDFAQGLGANKLALGHHFNDVIETTMLNLLYAGCYKSMMPRLRAEHFDNMELIRPMYYIEERDIIKFMDYSGLTPLNCACMVTSRKTGTKRGEVKKLIAELKKNNQNVDKCIFKSAENVYLECITGWHKNGVKHSFLNEDNSNSGLNKKL